MVTLYLVRHAEAEATPADFDRELTPYGKEQARNLGNYLKTREIPLDKIICSSAVRALTTAKLIAAPLGHTVHPDPAIYNASLDTLVQTLKNINSTSSILLVGHNPGVTLLLNYLADTTEESLSPCSLRIIELPADDWSSITAHSGQIKAP